VGAWLAGGSATCVRAHGRRAGGTCMRVVDVRVSLVDSVAIQVVRVCKRWSRSVACRVRSVEEQLRSVAGSHVVRVVARRARGMRIKQESCGSVELVLRVEYAQRQRSYKAACIA
jgi:hypothetical protein